MLLLAFNWYGYRLLINHMQDQANTELQASLDKNNYDNSQLITLRVPLNMPYITDWTDFESYEGETVIDGVHYKFVKRKIEKGELVLQCIPNQQKTDLETAKDSYFKLVNDIDHPSAKHQGKDKSSKTFSTDYFFDHLSMPVILVNAASKEYNLYTTRPAVAFNSTPFHPPKA